MKRLLALLLIASPAFAQAPIGGSSVRVYETNGGGNYVEIGPITALSANRTCTLEDDSTPFDQCVTASGGGTPGGSNTQIQFNDAGAFGGDAGFVYNAGTDTVTVGTATIATAATVAGNAVCVDSGSGCGGGGGGAFTVTSITSADSPYSLSSAGNILLLADTSSGSITVNLPDASGNTGKFYHIKKTSASNTLTLDGDGADTIEGAATFDWSINGQAFSITPVSTSAWVIF